MEMLAGQRREHFNCHSGMVEACSVHIGPIPGGLQPEALGKVIGGQAELLLRVLPEGAGGVGEPHGHSNGVLLLAELDPSVENIPLPPQLLYLSHHLSPLRHRLLQLRLRSRLRRLP
ncbi:hypothetical protein CR513_37574, partial [Mucuna pruriens]